MCSAARAHCGPIASHRRIASHRSDGAAQVMGPLTSEQNEMFLRNPRFLGLKFPDMTRPETLEKRCKTLRLRGAKM
jgi:hypothetical protein